MAVIVTGVEAATGFVVIVKLGDLVFPAATVTEAGTAATAELELDKFTTAPPGGAGPFNTTTLLGDPGATPPITLAGYRLRETSATGFTVRVAVWVVPL
jgi:hypothetical protein